MTLLVAAGALLLAYIIGAIPTGLIVARQLAGIDIRQHGSKNIGATNVWRVLGWKLGLTTFLIDVAKAFLGVMQAVWLGGGGVWLPVLAAFAVLLGNFFNVFLGFKGGKGVAASLGVFLALAPLPVLIAFLLFVVVVGVSGYISLGSVLAALALPVLVYTLQGTGPVLWLIVVVAVLVIAKHRANIVRLLNGTESKFRIRSRGAA